MEGFQIVLLKLTGFMDGLVLGKMRIIPRFLDKQMIE